MKPFSLYGRDDLPAGFRYPESIVLFAEGAECPDIAPWWFVDASSEAGRLFHSIRRHDGRNLVPFAKGDDDDDIACFDGDDLSGDPEVLMLVLDASGRHYSFASFKAWLEAVRR